MAHLQLHVTPGARQEGIAGWQGRSLWLRVRERPRQGRANDAALRLLARRLGVPRSSLTIVRGEASREKLVEVEGLSDEELQAMLVPPARQRPPPGAPPRRGRAPR